MMRFSDETRTQRVRNVVEQENDEQDQQDHIGHLVPVGIGAHRFQQFQADTPGSHRTDDGGGPGVALPEIE